MKNSGKIAWSLAAVFAAGAMAGVLLAPARGIKTRARISRKGRDLIHKMDEAIREGKDSLSELRESIKC